MNERIAVITRETTETKIECRVNLDGSGRADIQTGIGFYDHLLTALARHSRIDLTLSCSGDLPVDDHHTVEDCALAIGRAIDQALGERRGITRFGWALAPLDEALARVAVDLSGRPFAAIALHLKRDAIGALACENIAHALQSLAFAARMTLHVEILSGENDHHKAEAAFKALALSLRQAIRQDDTNDIASTKGTLT
ncbi:MAG TPA: imidazoleglycerol-phosphate dehydratase HisB [bacterium]|nr:imidazoleglycerol-phosphate dehydratase HisB [bacterium]